MTEEEKKLIKATLKDAEYGNSSTPATADEVLGSELLRNDLKIIALLCKAIGITDVFACDTKATNVKGETYTRYWVTSVGAKKVTDTIAEVL